MPGLVPGIHAVPLQRTSLLNSRLFPQPAKVRPAPNTERIIDLDPEITPRCSPALLSIADCVL
jgi:hypothetical protein